MAPLVDGISPNNQDNRPIKMTGTQVGGKGPDNNFHIFSTDDFGVLNVNTSGGGGTSNVNITQVGGAPISEGQTTMANSFPVVIASDQSAFPVNQGLQGTIAQSWFTQITDGTNVLGTPTHPIRTDPTGTTVQPVSGTVAISGPIQGSLTNNNAVPTSNNLGVLPAIANAAHPTYTEGDQVLLSTDLTGALRVNVTAVVADTVNQGTTPWIVAGGGTAGAPGTAVLTIQGIAGGTAVPVSGTVTVIPSGLQNVNLTQLNSVALGSPSNYGTSPGAISVQGVNAFITNTVATTLASTTITGTVAVTQSTSPWVVSLASTTITGTVAVTQSTSPWIIAGNLTTNNAAPIGNNVGVLPAVASAGAPTYIAGDQVLLSTDLAGNLRTTASITGTSAFNLAQWAGTVLGTPTNFGTTPGAVIAGSVNASLFSGTTALTNTAGALNVSLTSTTITGTVAVTQSTSPWVDNLTQVAGVVLGATAVTAFGTAPAAANVPGVNSSLFSGTTALTNTGGALNVNITNAAGPFTVAGNKSNNAAAPGATNLGVLPAIANAATQTWTEGDQVLESVDLSGRQRVRGTLTHNAAAPTSDLIGVMNGLANATAPTYTEGDLVLQSVDLSGNTRVVGTKTNNAAPTTQIGVMPALANAAAPTWTEGNQVLLSVDLSGNLRTLPTTLAGTLTNNNAAPGANNIGALSVLANAASPTWTEGDLVLVSADLTGRQRVRGTLTNNNAAPAADHIGVLTALANAAPPSFTEGDEVLLSSNLSGSLRVIVTSGTITVVGAKSTNAVVPGSTNIGVLPALANAVPPSLTEGNQVLESVDLAGNMRVGVQNLTTAPSLATGNTAQLQADYQGSLFVKPYRRGQTTAKATTISNSVAATTVLAAQAAGIFADIATLVMTVTPAPTATGGLDTAFTATLSDGTNSYIFDMDTGAVGTATITGGPPTNISVSFNPPLPATTAATAWTVTLSVAMANNPVHITVVAALQKAS